MLSVFALVSLFSDGTFIDRNTKENIVPELSLFSSKAPALGVNDAPIKLVEYGDYQCFHCNRFFHEIEPRILKNYIHEGKVKMIFKDFTIIGQDSVTAAHVSHCAREQGNIMIYFILIGVEEILGGHHTNSN